jgi:hypothetical protein
MEKKDVMQLMVAPAADVKRDMRRNLPWIKWLLIVTVIYVLTSSAIICLIEDWTFLHACYFTVINITTVGFGDVVPITHGGKLIAGINAFAGLLFFGILVAVIAMALQPSGWSATLTSTGSPNPNEQPKRIDDKLVENSVADFLESLATLVRATDKQEKITSREGRVRIEIMSDGHAPSHVHLFIDVRAG